MRTITKRSDSSRRLLLAAVVTVGIMIIMPQRTAAENVQENVYEGEMLVNQATVTWQNFMQDPDMSGFRGHVKGGQGVLIFPRLMKGAFVLGIEGGNGVLLVRDGKTGSWSEPAFYEISSASFGLQAGVEMSEAILIVQTVKGIESLLSSTIKFGADASAVIGPKGSGIEGATSMSMGKDFVTYARTKGAFVGLSVEGASIRTRDDLNKTYYGSAVRPSDIVLVRKIKPNTQSQVLHQAVVNGTQGDPTELSIREQEVHIIQGDVLRVEGNTYFIKELGGKELSLRTDATTMKAEKIQVGDRIEAKVDENNRALSLVLAP